MKKVVIIGGGPSGMLAAMAIKEHCKIDIQVEIVERLEKIGKKILATGNGKCNFTNLNVNKNKYNHPKFVNPTITKYGCKEIMRYLESIGLISKELTEGRIYPYSESATSVLDVLRIHLNRLGVEIRTNFDTSKVVFKDNKYLVYNKNQRNYFISCDYIIFACGGSSAEILGSNGSGYQLLKPWKINITDLYPGLVGLKCDSPLLKLLNGLRIKGKVSLQSKKDKKTLKTLWSEEGEIQFKNDGISGICVMQASSYIGRFPGTYILNIDFMPKKTIDDLINLLNIRKTLFNSLEVSNLLTGLFPKMLNSAIIKKSSIDLNLYIKDLTKQNIDKIADTIKNFSLDIKGNYGFDKSQVTVGGVSIKEINENTLKINKMTHAYICGEMIDVDGECGGYNLQWALASGYNAGLNLIMELENDVQNSEY